MRGDLPDDEQGLIDVSDMTLYELREWGDSSLLAEIRRVLRSDAGDSDAVSGFSNSI
jgi:FXSXX-COOH protein